MRPARPTTTATRLASTVVVGVLLGVPVALLLGLLGAGAAEATTYRYWTYWWGRPGKSGWTFASQGPASDVLGDGWVIGWRFATTSVNGGGGTPPRASHVYADLCSATSAPAGQRRVAVVVDYGTADVAPPGETPPGNSTVRVECVTIGPDSFNGFSAMRAAGITVRQGADGFVCGIDGYPRTECSAVVTPGATPAPTRPTSTPTRATTTAPARTPSAARSSTAATTARGAAGASSSTPTTATSPTTSATAAASTVTGSPTATDTPAVDAVPEATLPVASGAPASSTEAAGSPLGFLLGVLVLVGAASTAWLASHRRRGGSP